MLERMQQTRDGKPCSRALARKLRKTKRDTLQCKRAHDFATNGGSSSMERRVILRRILALRAHGVEMRLLNDGTRADVIVRTSIVDAWIRVQWKTTSSLRKDPRFNSHAWHFRSVRGYVGMLVVCECEADGSTWVFHGEACDKYNSLCISAQGELFADKYLGSGCTDAALADVFKATEAQGCVPLVREEQARSEFFTSNGQRSSHAVEYDSITHWRDTHASSDWYRQRHDHSPITHAQLEAMRLTWGRRPGHTVLPSGVVFRWPEAQQPHHDCEISFDAHRDAPLWLKVQLKTVHKRASCGYKTQLQVAGGTDERGVQLYDFYSVGDADLYVCILPPSSRYGRVHELHVWEFREAELVRRGYLQDPATGGGGIASLTVHMGAHSSCETPDVHRNFSLWTRAQHTRHPL